MKELLRRIDSDYYRFVQLLIAHAELEQLRQWRVDVQRRSKIPLGLSRALDSSRNLAALPVSSKRHPSSPRLPARDDRHQRHTGRHDHNEWETRPIRRKITTIHESPA